MAATAEQRTRLFEPGDARPVAGLVAASFFVYAFVSVVSASEAHISVPALAAFYDGYLYSEIARSFPLPYAAEGPHYLGHAPGYPALIHAFHALLPDAWAATWGVAALLAAWVPAALAAAAFWALCRALCVAPFWPTAFFAFANPSWLAVATTPHAEPLSAAAAMLGFAAWLRDRPGAGALLLSLAGLSRYPALLLLAPLAYQVLVVAGRRDVRTLALLVVPAAVFAAFDLYLHLHIPGFQGIAAAHRFHWEAEVTWPFASLLGGMGSRDAWWALFDTAVWDVTYASLAVYVLSIVVGLRPGERPHWLLPLWVAVIVVFHASLSGAVGVWAFGRLVVLAWPAALIALWRWRGARLSRPARAILCGVLWAGGVFFAVQQTRFAVALQTARQPFLSDVIAGLDEDEPRWIDLAAAAAPAAPSARNLLLVSVDTLRADRLSCYGYGAPTTPALDSLAADGALFEDASTVSPWTLPAHASLLTGLYPLRHGVRDVRSVLRRKVPTLAGLLDRLGFETAAVVNSIYFEPGFEVTRGFERTVYLPESGDARGAAGAVTDAAIDWLSRRGDARSFLFVHYDDLRSPYRALPEYERRFVPPYAGPADGTREQLLAFRRGEVRLDARDGRHLSHLYDAGVRQLDDELARLLAFLDESGRRDSTLVVVTSDHGEEFLEHGGVLHGRTHYQEVLHVPLLLRGPGVPAGLRVDTPVSLVDVVPTALASLGIRVPRRSDGVDLTSAWRGPGTPERPLFAEADHDNAPHDVKRAVRSGRFKLQRDLRTSAVALFDLAADPGETRDVAAEHADTTAGLLRTLEQFEAGRLDAQRREQLGPEQAARLRALGYLP